MVTFASFKLRRSTSLRVEATEAKSDEGSIKNKKTPHNEIRFCKILAIRIVRDQRCAHIRK